MAMTPWHTASTYPLEEAACLLAGEDPAAYELSGWQQPEVIAWERRLIEASAVLYEPDNDNLPVPLASSSPRIDLAGSLWVSDFEIRPGSGRGIRGREGQTIREPDDGASSSEMIFTIARRELQRWLRHTGVADRDMPEALRPTVEESTSAPAVKEELPSTLVTIAALLDLLKDDSRPRHNQTSIIAAVQERHPVRGVSESQLQKLFAEANRVAREAANSLESKG